MKSVAELATQLREFWLRDLGSVATTYSNADAGSVSLTNTLFIATSGGYVGINTLPQAPYALDVVGDVRIAGNLLDRSGNNWNIGSETNPWGAIYAADLHVGNLVAENKIATTGGRLLVSATTKLTAAVTAVATTIDVSTNSLANDDIIYLESVGKLEWMQVTSSGTAVTGGYRFTVTRDMAGAGAHTWKAGDAVVITTNGFIDIYSRYGIPIAGQTATDRVGPTIVGNVRTDSFFCDSLSERWAAGNLKGLYDYIYTEYGFAAGSYAAAWFSLDSSNGLRMMQSTTARVQLTPSGVFKINNSTGAAVFTFNASAGAEFTLPLTLGTNGGIYQGTGSFATPTTGLKIYNSGGIGRIAGYNTGVVQWYADTDGKLYAGAGAVKLDVDGITLNKGTGYAAASALKWGNDDISVTGYYSLATNRLFLLSQQLAAGAYAQSNLQASGGTSGGGIGQVYIVATGNGALASVSVQSNTGITMVGAVGITGNVTLTGSFGIRGATSGTATIVAPAVAGTPTLTLPTTTGTLALTSDITTAVVGTSGNLAKFTGTNAVGNSIITESGATLSAAGTFTIVGQSDTNQLIVRGHSTQTSPQILIQSSAAAELTRLYVNAAGAIAIGYQAGNALGTAGETVAIGYQAGLATTDNGGVYIGYQAGKAVTANGLTVQTNVAIGSGALQTNTTGYGNVAIGLESMKVYTGKQSIAIGDRTMLKATSGLYNFAFGEEALYNVTSGQSNEAIGIQALFSNNGSGNIGVGAWALYSNVSGSDNIAFGAAAAFHNTGSYNVEIGGNVGYNSLGSNSVMIGYEAGRTSGSATITDSVYIGYRTGYGASAGNNNVGIGSGALPKTVANAVAVGYQAGAVQTGAGFTAVGYQAGVASTSGTNSTLIGSGAGASLTTNGGCVMLGYQAGGSETGANKLYIHNSNSTTPLIYGDFSTPSLTFNGTVTIADGYNLASGTTTGMKLGTSTSQKLGVWNATPIVQPTTGVAAATFTANAGTAVNDASTFDGYTLKQVVKALRNIGLLA